MTTTDEITAAAQASAERYRGPRMNVGTLADREYVAHVEGWAACREYLAAQTAATAQDALLAVLPRGRSPALGALGGHPRAARGQRVCLLPVPDHPGRQGWHDGDPAPAGPAGAEQQHREGLTMPTTPTRSPIGIVIASILLALALGLALAAFINGGFWWLALGFAVFPAVTGAYGLTQSLLRIPRDEYGNPIKKES